MSSRKTSANGDDDGKKRQLMEELRWAGRHQARATVLFHQAVADRLGLHPTDQKCLDILRELGPISAGELAKATGLTSGAITGVADRLERAGFLRREIDPKDRRRILLLVNTECTDSQVAPLFEGIQQSWSAQCEQYSAGQLELILKFMRQTIDMVQRETTRLRETSPEAQTPK
ncbi:MAG: MarR family winged helix-turn-helix transcriptional regulator [Thermoanaerobaculia bacterium]